jgi:hypothetical protein
MHTMFGWRHGEMEGNNIKVIIPPPFNINHDAHVKACIAAKKETHMGDSKRALRVVAQHKVGAKHSLFPIPYFTYDDTTTTHMNQQTGGDAP